MALKTTNSPLSNIRTCCFQFCSVVFFGCLFGEFVNAYELRGVPKARRHIRNLYGNLSQKYRPVAVVQHVVITGCLALQGRQHSNDPHFNCNDWPSPTSPFVLCTSTRLSSNWSTCTLDQIYVQTRHYHSTQNYLYMHWCTERIYLSSHFIDKTLFSLPCPLTNEYT